jgi:hypothetical protein
MTTPICKLLSITFMMMNKCLTSSAGHGGPASSTDRTSTTPSNAPRTVPKHHQLMMTTPIYKLLSITFVMMNNCLTSSAGHGGLAWSTDRTPTPSGLGSAASSGSDAEAGKFFFILIIFDLANV